ncbi:MAG: hypothetical protein AB7F86_03775 [Bdellovibrionales bacterium]
MTKTKHDAKSSSNSFVPASKCWTIFVTVIVLSINSAAWANGSSAPNPSSAADKIEAEYKQCLTRSRQKLTGEEVATIKNFRQKVLEKMTPLRAKWGPQADQQYSQALMDTVDGYIDPIQATDRLMPRFNFAIAEEKLRRIAVLSVGLNDPDYKAYVQLAIRSVYKQVDIDLAAFKKAHEKFLHKVMDSLYRQVEQSIGVTAPLALKMSHPEVFDMARLTANQVSEIVAQVQVANAVLSGDQARFRWALALQAGYAVGGSLLFASTFVLGPLAVARGGALAVQLGLKAIQGSRAAGMGVGGIGAPGAMMVPTAYWTITTAYRRSSELGTPVNCELEREAAMANMGQKIIASSAFGMGAGFVGVSAAAWSLSTLKVTGIMAQIGLTYEAGAAVYEGSKSYVYCNFANQLEGLTDLTPELDRDRKALAKLSRNECYARLQAMGEHVVESAIIGALYRELFMKGHLREALDHGVHKAMGVMAYSSDSIPSVVTSGAKIGAAGYVSLSSVLDRRAMGPFPVPLADQIRTFLKAAQEKSKCIVDPEAFELTWADRMEWAQKWGPQ